MFFFQWINSLPKFKLRLYIVVCLFIIAILFKWQDVLYSNLLNAYLQGITHLASVILNALGFENSFISDQLQILIDQKVVIVNTKFASLKLMFLLSSVIIISFKNKQLVYLFPAFWLYAFVVNSFRIVLISLFVTKTNEVEFNHYALYMFFLTVSVLLLMIKKIGIASIFKVNELSQKITIIVVVASLYFIADFCYSLVPQVDSVIMDTLSNLILGSTQLLLRFLGYSAFIQERTITDGVSSIYMGDPCIGSNILVVFILFVFLNRTKIFPKLVFSFLGASFILLLNTLRVMLLFVFISENGNNSNIIQKQHDSYNLIIYLTVLILWGIWYIYADNLPKDK